MDSFHRELGSVMIDRCGISRHADGLREESCGAHFREEHQSDEGEARRDDVNFAHIAAWEHNTNGEPIRHSEPLQFTALQPSTRSYK